VVNFGIIHHVLDWRRAISEVSRVLKPGGTFYFEEIYPPLYANFILKRMLRHPTDDRFDGAQFLAQLAACGMRLVPGVCTDSRYGIVGAAVRD
jgi:SAM-dependent methyltransferase